MRREPWMGREEGRSDHRSHREDYGQADYSDRYRYDPDARSGYRADDDGWRSHENPYFHDRPRRPGDGRFFEGTRPERERRSRRDGPSDRVLWAVIVERLDDERRLDLSDVEVDVFDGEVTLNGYVKHKADKRRIEDIADIDGVRNVQNNLRVRERSRGWTFL